MTSIAEQVAGRYGLAWGIAFVLAVALLLLGLLAVIGLAFAVPITLTNRTERQS